MTVGNTASLQILMASALTNYSTVTGDTTYSSSNTSSSTSASEELDNILNTTLKGKSDYFKEQYSNLYKSIYGITDDDEETATSTASLKSTSAEVSSAADSLTSFAKALEYGGEYDADEYTELVQSFVDSYNSLIDKLGDSESSSVLQKGVVLVNTAKVYSSALSRAGITVGSDNKLTFDEDYLSEVSATDIKTTFGQYGFSEKAAQKAQQIKSASGSAGVYTYTDSSLANYVYSTGALFSIYA